MARAIAARILPMTTPEAEAEAIMWEQDTVVQVGSEEEVAAAAALRGIRLERMPGRTVIPGFVDAHMHFLHVGVKRTRPDLRGTSSKAEALQRVAAWLQKHDEPHVIAEGWDESEWDDGTPERAELDALSDRPLVLRRICGHVAVANTAALERVRPTWDDERVDAASGLLLEEPTLYLNEVLPAGPALLGRSVTEACRIAHHLGVTTVGDYEQAPFREALLRAARDGQLQVRLTCSIYAQQLEEAIRRGFRTGRPVAAAHEEDALWEMASAETEGAGPTSHGRLASAMGRQIAPPGQERPGSLLQDGGVKVFLDGSLGGHTAHMLEPYDDRATRGRANFSDSELDHLFRRAHAAGIQIHAHAIGDGAIEQGLQAFERLDRALNQEGDPGWAEHQARPSVPPPRHGRAATTLASAAAASAGAHAAAFREQAQPEARGAAPHGASPASPGASPVAGHRFEHFEIVHDDQARRAAALGLWASSQPNFVGEWSAHGGLYEQRIGQRFALNNRFRTWKQVGLRLAFGSDGMPFGPLYGIQSAVQHPDPDQRMNAREAVWHYTHESAASLARPEVGSLAAGQKADLLILEADVDRDAPHQWIIAETVLAGATVHRGSKPVQSDDDVPRRAG